MIQIQTVVFEVAPSGVNFNVFHTTVVTIQAFAVQIKPSEYAFVNDNNYYLRAPL